MGVINTNGGKSTFGPLIKAQELLGPNQICQVVNLPSLLSVLGSRLISGFLPSLTKEKESGSILSPSLACRSFGPFVIKKRQADAVFVPSLLYAMFSITEMLLSSWLGDAGCWMRDVLLGSREPGAYRQLHRLQPNWQRSRSQDAQSSPRGDRDVREDPRRDTSKASPFCLSR